MLKAIDKSMVIENIQLEEKSGGKNRVILDGNSNQEPGIEVSLVSLGL